METDRVTPEWGFDPFGNDSIDFNKSYVASVIAALDSAFTLSLGVNGPLHGEVGVAPIGLFDTIKQTYG